MEGGQTKGTDLLLPSLKTTEMMKYPRLFSLRDLKDTEALSFSSTAPINKNNIKSVLLKPNQIGTDIMMSIRKQYPPSRRNYHSRLFSKSLEV